ncbi:cell division protein DedD [Yersinia pseudotuberculosis]|uniref:Cell division protein DedD n=3 Tax=Yersinia pseudotuberculosis complex TaxID=1649845 RepID=A0A0H3B0G1_YERPY|nr:cell division protein DedD [Yersinia pseudotuberculosis]AJJ57744.1 sporulation related domain protein [Yersinia pseudotuberculosis YPIII]AYW87542.1 cell division protein DedD [Yersinia pseudotuberculosis]AYX02094.1 cell division protein DedD [Yersinia pseudotuberculosis]AZA29850.1 cell division protein DedD [Yersinia pseudotuberculosis]MBK1425380.1 cell division protein DedD [Yersinia pseudotuberculosis]
MASQFQNRLVGTIILVALGVIVLPGLLDGKKKHYEDEFAAIPLVPKPGDSQEIDVVPPLNQPLPITPPEGAAQAVGAELNDDSVSQAANDAGNLAVEPTIVAPPPIQSKPVEVKPTVTKPVDVKPTETKPTETKPIETKPAEKKPLEVKPKPEIKPPVEEKAPVGQAYVVQLGALKNAAKVNEIVAMLRLSGHRAFTVPATPVQGEITRLYVGPDASKQKLQSALPELNALSGLNGQVKPYTTSR